MKKVGQSISVVFFALIIASAVSYARAGEGEGEGGEFFKLYPVGKVVKKARTTSLEIASKYTKALKGLEGFSHVAVLYWFDKNDTPEKRSILETTLSRFPNKPSAGVFASRAPVRPNLIALSVCRILSVEGGTVHVQSIDAFDGTPILDLKPHIPMIDCPSNAKLPGWWTPAPSVERVMGFDANNDGKVSKEEMPGQMKERLLRRADANGDGALDKEEIRKFIEQMSKGQGHGQGGR